MEEKEPKEMLKEINKNIFNVVIICCKSMDYRLLLSQYDQEKGKYWREKFTRTHIILFILLK